MSVFSPLGCSIPCTFLECRTGTVYFKGLPPFVEITTKNQSKNIGSLPNIHFN